MGFKYKKGRLICSGKAGMMKGYIAEPGKVAEKKSSTYLKDTKKKLNKRNLI